MPEWDVQNELRFLLVKMYNDPFHLHCAQTLLLVQNRWVFHKEMAAEENETTLEKQD